MRIQHFAALALATLSLVACVGEEETPETADVQNVTAKSGGEVELYRSNADGEFRLRIKAKNGAILLAGEGYEAKAGAENAVEAISRDGAEEDAYSLNAAESNPDERYEGDWYFNVVAGNNAVLASSEIYSTKGNAQTGIETVMGYIAGGLKVDDWTQQCGFEIFAGADGDIWFRMRADNGEKLLRGEGYASESGAKEGIDDIVTHGYYADAYELKENAAGEYYFNVKAPNGEVLGTSEGYVEASSAEAAIEIVMERVAEHQWCWTNEL
jgi:uncharacterized protein